jgi:flagellar biosynthesis protein FlhF
MPSFTERAATENECLEKIKALYGNNFKILERQTHTRGGFWGMGGRSEVVLTGVYGYSLPKPQGMSSMPAPTAAPPLDLETAKRQVLAAAGKNLPDASYHAILKELSALGGQVRNLSEKIENKTGGAPVASAMHPSLQKLEEDLILNEFTPSFIKTILEKTRHEFSLNELDDYEEVQKKALLWIGESISVYREPEQTFQGRKKPRIIVLLGPTGVGKTTTVVKLANLYGEPWTDENKMILWQKQTQLITVDYWRIGAENQLQKIGEIMDLPVNSADSYDDLKKLFSLYRQDVDFILVDTTGLSPQNYEEMGKMKALLDACPARSEAYLCLPATFKPGDIKEICKQFEPFKYKSVIITKMDETRRFGNVISALAEERKSIAFFTTGQTIPGDIERATVIRLLVNLEGFTVDRLFLMDYFNSPVAGEGV